MGFLKSLMMGAHLVVAESSKFTLYVFGVCEMTGVGWGCTLLTTKMSSKDMAICSFINDIK
jgi:hypothetical protein